MIRSKDVNPVGRVSKMKTTLFDTPLSGAGDPFTSYESAEQLEESGRFQKQKSLVYRAIKARNGLTSAELANRMGVSRYLTARRLPDLMREGLVKQGPVRMCRATGRKCVTWFTSDMFGPV